MLLNSLPDFLLTDSQKKMRENYEKKQKERRLEACVPWRPDIKWEPELNIQAKTYKTLSLFDVPPCTEGHPNFAKSAECVHSPGHRFVYTEISFKRGSILPTVNGNRRGSVLFDDKIAIPCLHEEGKTVGLPWKHSPWMSLTPSELLTLRPGTKRAKGRVIIAGLGLGHQLIEVSKRKTVKELVVVERERELVDWLWPRIHPHLGMKVTVIVGDAYQVLPEMKADVALIDIFPSYGSNYYERTKFQRTCKGIKFIWAWGAAALADY